MLRTRGGRICLSDVIFVTAKKGMTLLLPPPPHTFCSSSLHVNLYAFFVLYSVRVSNLRLRRPRACEYPVRVVWAFAYDRLMDRVWPGRE